MINEKIKDKYPWKDCDWSKRTKFIASLIKPKSNVVDIGGGYGRLKIYLPKGCDYVSLDKEEWTHDTIKADFNKGEYPDLASTREKETGNVVVVQGVLEYIIRPSDLLHNIRKYGETLIVSYLKDDYSTREQNRFNFMNFNTLKRLLVRTGWTVKKEFKLPRNQRVFYCIKK
jgi:hypothetical protein